MGTSATKCCPAVSPINAAENAGAFEVYEGDLLPTGMLFPMWVLSVQDFLAMEGTPKYHQELMEGELLVKWCPTLFTVFVSHQWSSITHPDSEGKQVAVLRQAMHSIISGSLSVATTIEEEAVFKYFKRMPVHIRESLRTGYIWMDWFAIPQLRPGCAEADVKREMLKAVNSIPSYVAKADLFIVVAPSQNHYDTGSVLDFSSWSDRGWCRTELACRALAERDDSNEMIIIKSGTEAKYGAATEWMFAPPGDGNFTADSDRQVLFPVICAAIDRKIEHEVTAAAQSGRGLFRVRMYTGMRSIALSRLVDDSEASHSAHWHADDDEVAFLEKFKFASVLDKGEKGVGPLMCAVLEDNPAMIEKILAAGVEVESRIIEDAPEFFLISQSTPLMLASFMGFLKAVRCLLSEKANVHSTESFGATPLHNAVFGGRQSTRTAIVDLLMENKADPEKRNQLGMTVLAVACIKCHSDAAVECVRNLLVRGARVDAVDNQGQTPLHIASLFGGRAELVQLLIQFGSVVNQKIIPETIIGGFVLNASRFGMSLGLESAFLQHFGEARGGTALHVAGFSGHKDIYRLLLLARADATIQNARGHTALELARKTMHDYTFNSLLANSVTELDVTRLHAARANRDCTPPPSPRIDWHRPPQS